MKTRMLGLIAGSASLYIAALPAHADPTNTICGQLGCMKAYNHTGLTANDFHMEFTNISSAFYHAAFSQGTWIPTFSPLANGFKIDWAGASIPPGGCIGVGVSFNYSSNHIPDNAAAASWWTFNGQQIGPRVGGIPYFRFIATGGGGGTPTTGLHGWNINSTEVTLDVQRRATIFPGEIDFETLMNDVAIYNDAVLIDPAPISWGPGEELSYDFELVSDEVTSYILIYDVYNPDGTLSVTTYEVAYAVPGTGCAADLNADSQLDFFDVQIFLGLFSAQDPQADFTFDGSLDFFDVQAFLNAFSAGCP